MSPSAAVLLKQLIDRKDQPQKAIALSWLERWNAVATRSLALTTVSPRLSNALSDQLDGWQFYFGTPLRASILLEVLDATPAERDALLLAVAERLSTTGAARVAIDIHDLTGDPVAMLAEIDRVALADSALLPAVVLLSPEQYGKVPMAYSERQEQLRLVKVPDDAAGATALSEHPCALVLASQPPRDPDTGGAVIGRWAAIDWQKGKLKLDPEDALVTFKRDGTLADLPRIVSVNRLDALGVPPETPKARLHGAALRKRLFAINDGTLAAPPGVRLGEALAFGIDAASTDDERVRASLLTAGLPPEVCVDAPDLGRALARAELRPTAPAVYLADGVWHLLNAPAPASLAGHARVRLHAATAGATALQRLSLAVTARTSADWELDPRLETAMASVGGDAAALRHARSWLVYGGHCSVSPAVSVSDAAGALSRLLSHPAPNAELRVTQLAVAKEVRAAVLLSTRVPDRLKQEVWCQVPSVGSTFWQSREEFLTVAWIDHEGPVRLPDPRQRAHAHVMHGLAPQVDPFAEPVWEGEAALPSARPLDDDAWLDAYEARGPDHPAEHLRRRHGAEVAREVAPRKAAMEAYDRDVAKVSAYERDYNRSRRPTLDRPGDGHQDGDGIKRCSLRVNTLPGPDWEQLDLSLALAWDALRAGIAESRTLTLRDGRLLVPIAPGLLAELRVLKGPKQAPRAAFGREVECGSEVTQRNGWTYAGFGVTGKAVVKLALSPVFAPLLAWEAHAPSIGAVQIGVSLPVALRLVGEGIVCDVRFVSDPYGVVSGRVGDSGRGQAVVAGVAAAEAGARRRASE